MALGQPCVATGGADRKEEAELAAGTAEEKEGGTDDLPELLDLIDAIEQAVSDVTELATVIKKIGRRIHASPGDRDLLTDFDGTAQICRALAETSHRWQGDAMLAFCRVMPDICRTSNVNRGALRDEGFVAAVVELLRGSTTGGAESDAIAASVALGALCTSNDGNKSAAAQPMLGDMEDSSKNKPGAIHLLLEVLERYPECVTLQTEAIAALRSLVVDDDTRKSSSEPCAVENREILIDPVNFPKVRVALLQAFATADASERPQVKLCEQSLLLLREVARGPDFIRELAFEDKLLNVAKVYVETAGDARLVRAGLAVLRAFAFEEDVRDELAMLSNAALICVAAVQKNVATPTVCEQGFGLFGNLTMRKSPIAARLNDGGQMIALGEDVLRQHPTRPDVARAVINTLRNVSTQDDAAAVSVRESNLFSELRKIVLDHEAEARWNSAVDVARQFLREFRADEGVQKAPQYNAFY